MMLVVLAGCAAGIIARFQQGGALAALSQTGQALGEAKYKRQEKLSQALFGA
jgi:hypothetical protein